MDKDDVASLNKALSRINGLYQRWYQARGLNSYLTQTLNALVMEPGLSQREISDNYQIPRQTVNNAVLALKRDGYVELQQDSGDRRRKKIVFTDAGRNYVQQTVSPIQAMDERIAGRMGEERYKLLIALLREYGDALEQETASEQAKGN